MFLLSIALLNANEAPIVSGMSAAQRSDGSYMVDVYYSVQDADSAHITIGLMVSSDGGNTWNISCDLLSGDIGVNISPGINKHIIWNLGSEHPNIEANYHFKVTADDGYVPPVPGGFVLVPGGTFTMGRTTGTGDSEELPTHSVTLNSFYMGKYEVTQGEYQAIMGSNPAHNYGVGTSYPVYYVSWYSVIKYCNLRSMNEGLTPVYTISGTTNPANWGAVPTSNNSTWDAAICNWAANGYRLPTEAEWEYAARGGTNTPDYLYSGSNDINAVAWNLSNSSSASHIVGTKAANALGIYDMSGNVWERCWDWYSGSYYSSSPSTNPKGPTSGSARVVRGGSWYSGAGGCRVAFRNSVSPYTSYVWYGFRLCRSGL
jgi:formylglycine-generating enzyme required for sulfatase activity